MPRPLSLDGPKEFEQKINMFSSTFRKIVNKTTYPLKRVKIRQEQKGKFPKLENTSEVETLDDCLMEGNATLFARVKVANERT